MACYQCSLYTPHTHLEERGASSPDPNGSYLDLLYTPAAGAGYVGSYSSIAMANS